MMASFIGDIFVGRVTLQGATDYLRDHLNSKREEKLPTKMDDPGEFHIPITIGRTLLRNFLVDTGASINVISLSTARLLCLKHMVPTKSQIELVDGSPQSPLGILVNIPIIVGGSHVLIDIFLLDMSCDGSDLILGRTFLVTTHASISIPKKRIKLRVGNKVICFPMKTVKRYLIVFG